MNTGRIVALMGLCLVVVVFMATGCAGSMGGFKGKAKEADAVDYGVNVKGSNPAAIEAGASAAAKMEAVNLVKANIADEKKFERSMKALLAILEAEIALKKPTRLVAVSESGRSTTSTRRNNIADMWNDAMFRNIPAGDGTSSVNFGKPKTDGGRREPQKDTISGVSVRGSVVSRIDSLESRFSGIAAGIDESLRDSFNRVIELLISKMREKAIDTSTTDGELGSLGTMVAGLLKAAQIDPSNNGQFVGLVNKIRDASNEF